MQTVIGLNSPQAVKRFSATLMYDTAKESYWDSRFSGRGQRAETPVQVLTDLESDEGDTIKYDLLAQLEQEPTYGDSIQEGTEENIRYFQDEIYIDQVRCGVNAGGRMTRKRTLHDLRMNGKSLMADWWARWRDEIKFMYASGARGSNKYLQKSLAYNGFAGNSFQAPDSDHRLFGGDATAFNNIASDDKFTLGLIDRAVTRADTMGGEESGIAEMHPINIEGGKHYVCVMHTYQEHDLRTSTTDTKWFDLQKALATSEGRKSPLCRGGMGMYRNVVLHSHKSVVRFNNAGADGLQPAARALFLGRQALIGAFGSPGGGLRYDWHEETRDNGNQVIISSSTIEGCKKNRFNGRDFGLMSLDTYAADPG